VRLPVVNPQWSGNFLPDCKCPGSDQSKKDYEDHGTACILGLFGEKVPVGTKSVDDSLYGRIDQFRTKDNKSRKYDQSGRERRGKPQNGHYVGNDNKEQPLPKTQFRFPCISNSGERVQEFPYQV